MKALAAVRGTVSKQHRLLHAPPQRAHTTRESQPAERGQATDTGTARTQLSPPYGGAALTAQAQVPSTGSTPPEP